jgi:hypothetical protein
MMLEFWFFPIRATIKGCQLYWVLLTIKLDFKGLEGNTKDVDFLKKGYNFIFK